MLLDIDALTIFWEMAPHTFRKKNQKLNAYAWRVGSMTVSFRVKCLRGNFEVKCVK